jgi:hypothetical protein
MYLATQVVQFALIALVVVEIRFAGRSVPREESCRWWTAVWATVAVLGTAEAFEFVMVCRHILAARGS